MMARTLALPQRRTVDEWLVFSFWGYLLLVLFDAALRKWFLPFLSNPLLLARDGWAFATCVYALWQSRFATNWYVLLAAGVTLLGCAATMTLGHGSAAVMLYGARIYLFHFPLIFIYARAMQTADLRRVNTMLMWTTIVSTIVLVAQFYSPQSAWVNRGVGGNTEGSGFQGGALGFARPAGLFSFTSGNVQFYGLVFACAIAGWLDGIKVRRGLLVAATAACIIAIPVSISRGYFVQCILTIVFALAAAAGRPKYIKSILLSGLAAVLLFSVLNLFPFFQQATEVLSVRFDKATVSEGGIENTVLSRVFGEKINAFTDYWDLGFFGAGLGYSTNVGAKVLTGDVQFLSAEDEWGRTTSEVGVLLGSFIILLRTVFGVSLLLAGWQALRRSSPYTWVLMSVVFLTLFSGQLGNPTGLGFTVVMCAMALVGLRLPAPDAQPTTAAGRHY